VDDQDIHQTPARQILRLPAVMARTGMGRSWIYREMAAGRFVPCVKIGRASGWDSAAVDAWIRDQIQSSG
jgi:prophage regulatory protein